MTKKNVDDNYISKETDLEAIKLAMRIRIKCSQEAIQSLKRAEDEIYENLFTSLGIERGSEEDNWLYDLVFNDYGSIEEIINERLKFVKGQ